MHFYLFISISLIKKQCKSARAKQKCRFVLFFRIYVTSVSQLRECDREYAILLTPSAKNIFFWFRALIYLKSREVIYTLSIYQLRVQALSNWYRSGSPLFFFAQSFFLFSPPGVSRVAINIYVALFLFVLIIMYIVDIS